MILAADEPRHSQGTSGKGRAYDFWSQRLQIWTGNKAVECTARADKRDEFKPVPVGSRGTFKVLSGRVFNGALSFDIEL